MNSLFELSAQYQSIMSYIMDIDDVSEDLLQQLESINDSLENKILNYASIIKSLESKSESINKAIDDMHKRAERLSKSASRLRERVKEHMEQCNKDRVENDYHEIKIKINNPKVNVIDETLIPDEYFRKCIKETIELNKMLIAKSLKDNMSIPGVHLVRETRLEIK